MADLGLAILSALANARVLQYPDKNLYNSAVVLKPEERPTVPVRLYDDSQRLFEEVLRRIGGAPLSERAIGVTPRDRASIYIKRGTPEYNNRHLLASKLAHEQVHVTQTGAPGPELELPAYLKEMDVMARFGSRIPPEYMDGIREYVQRLRATVKNKK